MLSWRPEASLSSRAHIKHSADSVRKRLEVSQAFEPDVLASRSVSLCLGITIKEKSKNEVFLVIDDEPGLLSVAQIAGLEVHVWGSQADKPEQPDRLIFDLDADPSAP
jgi:DNA primase